MSEAIKNDWAHQQSACGCHAINIAQPVNFCPKHAAVDALVAALTLLIPKCSRVISRDTGEQCGKLAGWWGSFGFRFCREHKKDTSHDDEDAQQAIAALALAGEQKEQS